VKTGKGEKQPPGHPHRRGKGKSPGSSDVGQGCKWPILAEMARGFRKSEANILLRIRQLEKVGVTLVSSIRVNTGQKK